MGTRSKEQKKQRKKKAAMVRRLRTDGLQQIMRMGNEESEPLSLKRNLLTGFINGAILVLIILTILILITKTAHCETLPDYTIRYERACLFDASAYFMFGGFVADYFSSQWLDPERFREGNIFMNFKWYGQAAFMGGHALLALMTKKMLMETGRPRAARIMMYISGALHYGCAAWNLQLRLRN